MAIPDFQSVMRPVLFAVASGETLSLSRLREKVSSFLQLSEAELHERLPSGSKVPANTR